jgi:hypothetical protein
MMRLDLGQNVSDSADKAADANNNLVGILQTKLKMGYTLTTNLKTTFDYDEFAKFYESVWTRSRCTAKCLWDINNEYKSKMSKVTSLADLLSGASISEPMVCATEAFFFHATSCLESLAWIFQLLWQTKLQSREISFSKIVGELEVADAHFKTLKGYDTQPGWIWEMKQYRDYVTHYGWLDTKTGLDWKAGTFTGTIYMLPDNPKDAKQSYEKKRELNKYCEGVMVNLHMIIRDSIDLFSRVLQ